MPAWVFGQVSRITDREAFGVYQQKAKVTVEQYGGKFLGGWVSETAEGDWAPAQVVGIEFPDMAALRAWYASPEYQPLIPDRHAVSDSGVVFVDGGQ